MEFCFKIVVDDSETFGPYVAFEIRDLNDGEVWRPSPLRGYGKNPYEAIKSLCELRIEMGTWKRGREQP